jgi:hypothetical protein
VTEPLTIRADLDRIRQLEYLTVRECSLLVNCSRPTIRRRLPRLGDAVLRDGGIIRVRRVALMRLFHRDGYTPRSE